MLKCFSTAGVLLVILSTSAAAAPVVFSVGGSDSGSIQATVDVFRAALGGVNNGNAPGPIGSGRREINWDGGGSTATSPSGTPFDVFLNTRGAEFTTPGTGFVQAPTDGLEAFFGNPTYGGDFTAFSPVRLFTPVASNVTDVRFFVPGTSGLVAATVAGFGAVFGDVDLEGVTGLQFFDSNGSLLSTSFVPAGATGNGSLSFLGVIFDAGERIGHVRIVSGNTPLAAAVSDGGGVDLVVLDDVLYSEPQEIASVPEPASVGLLATGVLSLAALRGRRRARRQ